MRIIFLILFMYLALCVPSRAQTSTKAQTQTPPQTPRPAKSQSFSFGGFQLMMSEADQKKAFPNSVIQHSDYSDSFTIAPQDRKDLVTYGSIFKHKNQADFAQLHFSYDIDPKKDADYYRNEFNQHPRCETVLNPLIKRYGAPILPEDGGEEGLIYKHYLWETDQEKLVLFCARYIANKSKKTFARAVQISRNPPGSGCKRRACIDPLP